jgi:hypothetical protein
MPSNSLSLAFTTMTPTRPPREELFVCSFHSRIEHRTLASTFDNAFWMDGSWTLRKREAVGDEYYEFPTAYARVQARIEFMHTIIA